MHILFFKIRKIYAFKNKKSNYERWLKEKSKTKEKIEVKEGKLDNRFYLIPGKYKVVISGGGKTNERTFSQTIN